MRCRARLISDGDRCEHIELAVESHALPSEDRRAHMARTSRIIVTFGDPGSLQHNGEERAGGDTLKNPYQSMEKQGFLS
jgi:hypothetical protein